MINKSDRLQTDKVTLWAGARGCREDDEEGDRGIKAKGRGEIDIARWREIHQVIEQKMRRQVE